MLGRPGASAIDPPGRQRGLDPHLRRGIVHARNKCLPPVILNLRRGCITHDQATGLWLMTGLYFKDAQHEDGSKIPEGQIRPDPWVIIEIVANAVTVLERLHPSQLL